jgi:hypothetical protein
MGVFNKLKRIFRGEVSTRTAALETVRRVKSSSERRRELAALDELNSQPATLGEQFARMSDADLLVHFRSRERPRFLPGFQSWQATGKLQQELFQEQTDRLLVEAHAIVDRHCWPLLGFGEKCFGSEAINWNRDPLSGFEWPLDFHADVTLTRNDGSDARVLWELNRLSHFITLGRAFAITGAEKFSTEWALQLASWRAQNPVGRGPNWNCAMEVALRSMNLLAAFTLFLDAPQLTDSMLKDLLMMFDQHGAHIERNLEFSHIATSNHYLSDVVGLLWLGVMLPELAAAEEWREFGLSELRSEMDKQVLPDGADYEASTGYHRFMLELFLYSFILCDLNGIELDEKYQSKLRAMIEYVRAYTRTDGRAPLIGDSDSGRVLPMGHRKADDHAYLLAIGAAMFQESRFKIPGLAMPEELLWTLGEQGVQEYQTLAPQAAPQSQAFVDAGTYLLRDDDLYLLFNVSDVGVNGRGSHGHNDALSVEVSVAGTAFIVDPGTYVYTANLRERNLFRSTAYHSNVQVDGVEQNKIDEQVPFIIGNEAKPRTIEWSSGPEEDLVVAEHSGYRRLPQPVTHQRSVRFRKQARCWVIEDRLTGEGTHGFNFRFHLAPEVEASIRPDGIIELCAKIDGARLLIVSEELNVTPEFEARFSSSDYGEKKPSVSVCWKIRARTPLTVRFTLLPVENGQDCDARISAVSSP